MEGKFGVMMVPGEVDETLFVVVFDHLQCRSFSAPVRIVGLHHEEVIRRGRGRTRLA